MSGWKLWQGKSFKISSLVASDWSTPSSLSESYDHADMKLDPKDGSIKVMRYVPVQPHLIPASKEKLKVMEHILLLAARWFRTCLHIGW